MKVLLSILLLMITVCTNSQMVMRARHHTVRLDTASGGGGGSEQNLILYSEELDDATWGLGRTGNVTANNETDLNSGLTMEGFTPSGDILQWGQNTPNIDASTDYVISFEVNSDNSSLSNQIRVILQDQSYNTIDNFYYESSVTGSVQRLSYEFTSTGTTTALRVFIAYSNAFTGDQLNIGRVHLYEGNIGDKDYITTTSTQVE